MFAVTTNSGQLMCPGLDVCKLPTPGGPVPTPYPNTAPPALGQPTTTKVLIGGMPALHRNSKCTPSSGDEPGVAGGVASSMIKGPVGFVTSSTKVMLQGTPAVRLSDTTTHNNNNAAGSVAMPSQNKVMIMS